MQEIKLTIKLKSGEISSREMDRKLSKSKHNKMHIGIKLMQKKMIIILMNSFKLVTTVIMIMKTILKMYQIIWSQ